MAKPFSWSFSKLKGYETCPLQYQQTYLLKNFRDNTEQLDWGEDVHKKIANALVGNTPLPPELQDYEPWLAKVRKYKGIFEVEKQYAITKDFRPTPYFGPGVWFRCRGDLVVRDAPIGIILDWKTGNIRPDSIQLFCSAQAIFSHYPDIHRVVSKYAWLKECTKDTPEEDLVQTSEMYSREDMVKLWPGVLERVEQLREATESNTFPPNPSCNLCRKWCPVTSCAYHGKGVLR